MYSDESNIGIVYFSNLTNNTHRFVQKLNLDQGIQRIPVKGDFEEQLQLPYVLITPTYGNRGVPVQVVKFLRNPKNRQLLTGVIASGNTNFGDDYAKAGHVISQMFKVPLLYTFELLGTRDDVENIEKGLKNYVIQYDK